ncbi:DNA polymerase III subunit gamma/tau [Oscillibacter sp.]|uniref:DNA polymerase III subunit gamma/tau n=1 Tax=Oscillibacter sp. TaxID=1945593 RepID=UPI0033984932
MYQALYRKWRPKTFSDVIGQSHITETLKRQVAEGRTSHAYLFTGTRGTGKTTCAKILAKAVNCEHPVDGDPCNQCPSCLGIENGTFLDVLELDAASNNGVDQVRALRDEAIYSPANVKKRVYIVDEVHMLSVPAFNALLKILEEPPEHLMFILATTELHKVPATILSRCQRYSFKRITPQDVCRQLSFVARQESINLQPDGAELLSRLADGALRDGLSLLDQCAAAGGVIDARTVLDVLGLAGNLQTAQLMDCVLRRDAKAALLLMNQLYAGGKDVGAVLNELSTLTRDLLLRRTAPEGGAALLSGGFDGSTLDRLEKDVPGSRLLYLATTLQQATADLYYSSNRRTDAELCLLRLCDETLSGDLSALMARVQRVEDTLERLPALLNSGISEQPGKPAPARPAAKPSSPVSVPADSPPWDEEKPPLPQNPPLDDERPPLPEEPPEPSFEREPLAEETTSTPSVWRETASPTPAMGPANSAPAGNASGAIGGAVWWRALAEECKGRLPPMYRAFLDKCRGELKDGVVTVYAPDEIIRGRLDNDRVLGTLQELSALKVRGPVTVRLTVGSGPASSPEDKLQGLIQMGSQLDNFTIQ